MAREVGGGRDTVVALDLVGRILVVRTLAARVEVPAPVDYVVWTEAVRKFAERKNSKDARHEILVTGIASERAHAGLQAAGWTLQEHSSR